MFPQIVPPNTIPRIWHGVYCRFSSQQGRLASRSIAVGYFFHYIWDFIKMLFDNWQLLSTLNKYISYGVYHSCSWNHIRFLGIYKGVDKIWNISKHAPQTNNVTHHELIMIMLQCRYLPCNIHGTCVIFDNFIALCRVLDSVISCHSEVIRMCTREIAEAGSLSIDTIQISNTPIPFKIIWMSSYY